MTNKPHILIVDDNVNLRKTMSLILKRQGYTVTTAEDGQKAIVQVEQSLFDMILMDIKMPLMNGVEAYKRIKAIRPESVVLMMTAHAVEDLVQEALEEGVYGIVYKPLDIEKLLDLIKKSAEIKQRTLTLVVDDDPGTCAMFTNVLDKKGYKVGIAHTGEEAITLTQQNRYDIIFIDVKLPTINGLETYLSIKETNPDAVVIMMTAYRQETSELVAEALHNSAYTCLYKPLDMKKVLELVEEVWKKKRTAA